MARVLIVPDIHLNTGFADRALAHRLSAGAQRIVLLGDIFDAYDAKYAEQRRRHRSSVVRRMDRVRTIAEGCVIRCAITPPHGLVTVDRPVVRR